MMEVAEVESTEGGRPRLLVLERMNGTGNGPTSRDLSASVPFDVAACGQCADVAEALTNNPAHCVIVLADSPEEAADACQELRRTSAGQATGILVVLPTADARGEAAVLDAGADDVASHTTGMAVLGARVRAHVRRRQAELVRLANTQSALLDEGRRRTAALDALSYAVSHDLRAPLRSIDGFSAAVMEHWGDTLDPKAKDYLGRVRAAAVRMADQIDALLSLSRLGRAGVCRAHLDLTELVSAVARETARKYPARRVAVDVAEGLVAVADRRMMERAFELLLDNCWKFSANVESPEVRVYAEVGPESVTYIVTDNGAGFDMTYANKLGRPFQRLHTTAEFPGVGMGLAIVQRVVDCHGGRLEVEGGVGVGATVRLTLPSCDAARSR